MTISERHTLKDLLSTVNTILTNNNIDWIPTGGSLLAVYRHEKLFIKWDDDYDITVANDKANIAVNVLKEELPKHECSIIFYKKWNGGLLYRIFFNEDNVKHSQNIKNKGWGGNWPFIDLFINVPKKQSWSHPNNITKDEYPLIQLTIEGMIVKVPSSGIRSRESFKNSNLFSDCKEQSFSHKENKIEFCVGPRELHCDIINTN